LSLDDNIHVDRKTIPEMRRLDHGFIDMSTYATWPSSINTIESFQ
jgi:hypothetical protein